MTIDSHHHFWHYSAAEYPWIGEGMSVLQRDYLPADLKPELPTAGIDGVVTVQARQSIAETAWLCELAEQTEFIKGVVGWVPLAESTLSQTLDALASPWLKGVRHVVQEEQADEFLLRPEFNAGIRQLSDRGLVYDLLILGRQLSPTLRFVDQHPDQPFVLDHIAKPTITPGHFDPHWAEDFRKLAQRENVTCKFSGVTTEVRADLWTIDSIRPYWDTALAAFGPSRLMFGSDWPVCLLKTSYHRWCSTLRTLTAELSESEQAAVWGNTASRIYQLEAFAANSD